MGLAPEQNNRLAGQFPGLSCFTANHLAGAPPPPTDQVSEK